MLKDRRKFSAWMAAAALLVGTGIGAYFSIRGQSSQTYEEASLQSAVARRGELVISATGTGTLTAPEEDLGFKGSGEMTVTGVYVKAGDLVQEGDVLAAVDNQQAQREYAEAQRAYADLTSLTAQAAALRAVADAEARLQSSENHLEYLISPNVMYWEAEIATGEEILKEAESRLDDSSSDEAVVQYKKDAAAFLAFAKDQLADAWEKYYDEYVPNTFGIAVDADVDTYAVPSDLEILQARTAIVEAEKNLNDSKGLYGVLTGEPMPNETLNETLLEIKQASRRLEQAKVILDGSQIRAPYSGTVLSVSVTGGNTVEPNPTDVSALDASTIVVLADTSQPYLDVFWDESDWPMLKVDDAVEITFDDLPDQVFPGRITKVDAELYTSRESTAIRGQVSLESPFADLNLPVGASASVDAISARAEDAILIPIEALHETTPGNYIVFVLQGGKVRLQAVEVGLMDELSAQVISGLNADEVVTTGVLKTQ